VVVEPDDVVVVVVVGIGGPVVVVVAAGCADVVVVVDGDGLPPLGGTEANVKEGPVGALLAAGGKPQSAARLLRALPSMPSAQMPTPAKLLNLAISAAS
jgi:hypothetical protein